MPQYFEIAKAVLRQNDAYLLLKRAPHSVSYPNTWDFAGGKLDPGETPAESVVRETKEEAGLDILPGLEVKEALYEDEDYRLMFYYFYPELPEKDPVLSDAHTEILWMTKAEMRRMDLHPSAQKFLENDF